MIVYAQCIQRNIVTHALNCSTACRFGACPFTSSEQKIYWLAERFTLFFQKQLFPSVTIVSFLLLTNQSLDIFKYTKSIIFEHKKILLDGRILQKQLVYTVYQILFHLNFI